MMRTVQNLNKVSLRIQAGISPEEMNIAPTPIACDFIFGVATEGMTPFEYHLVNKAVGDEVLIHLKKESFSNFFEHIHLPLGDLFRERNEAYLKVSIADAVPADNRSILKAMSAATAHGGGGCDCGCGCG